MAALLSCQFDYGRSKSIHYRSSGQMNVFQHSRAHNSEVNIQISHKAEPILESIAVLLAYQFGEDSIKTGHEVNVNQYGLSHTLGQARAKYIV